MTAWAEQNPDGCFVDDMLMRWWESPFQKKSGFSCPNMLKRPSHANLEKVPQEELARILGNTVPARKKLPTECDKKAWLCWFLPEKIHFLKSPFQTRSKLYSTKLASWIVFFWWSVFVLWEGKKKQKCPFQGHFWRCFKWDMFHSLLSKLFIVFATKWGEKLRVVLVMWCVQLSSAGCQTLRDLLAILYIYRVIDRDIRDMRIYIYTASLSMSTHMYIHIVVIHVYIYVMYGHIFVFTRIYKCIYI